MVNKSAFTLIELVFAIVIIAISVISLPMMNQAIAKGVDSNLVQEAIFAASAKLNESVSAHWDENSMEPTELNTLARVIDLGGCENNSSLSTVRERPGHINQPLHRRCLDSNATTPDDNANTTALVDDLNDMAVTYANLTTDQLTTQAGYKKQYTLTVTITRPANFGVTANNPNIKEISVEVFDKKNENKLITRLRTYSANIGEVDYYKRNF